MFPGIRVQSKDMESECDNRAYDRRDVRDHGMCKTPRL